MTVIAWIILGLIAGWIANLLMGSGGFGLLGDMALGILGAIASGELASRLLRIDMTGFNIPSLAFSVAGAVIVITYCALWRRTAYLISDGLQSRRQPHDVFGSMITMRGQTAELYNEIDRSPGG